MKRLGYAEANYGTLSISGDSESAATEVVSLPDMSFDGATEVLLEFNILAWGATTGFDNVLVFFDGDTPLGEFFRARSWASPGASPGSLFFRVLIPSAGKHRFNVRGWRETGGSFGLAADKANENASPAFLRAYALSGPGTSGSAGGTKVEVGYFTVANVLEAKTITLLDEDFGQIDALLVFSVALGAPADTDGDAVMSVGVGTYRGGAVQQYCATVFSDDAVSPSSTAIGGSTTSIARTYATSPAPAVDYDVALVSLGDAQFRINVTDLPATVDTRFYFMAIGGTQVTDALTATFNSPSTTGDQDVTVATGFGLPDLLLSLVGHPPGGDAATNIRFQLGAGKNETDMAATAYNEDNGAATMELSAYQDDVFMAVPNNDTAMAQVATLAARSSWPTDGFRINKSVAALTVASMCYLALRGTFTSVIGAGTAPTAAAPQTQDLEVAATPRGAIFFHNALPAIAGQNNSDADLGMVGIGITDGVRQFWVGIGNDDANGTSTTHRHSSESKAIRMLTPSAAGTLTSEASIAIVGTALRLTWADTDTVAREYRYLLLGETVAGVINPDYRQHPKPILRTVA